MFLFNKVVFTFFQAKELNEVVLGNWFRTGVGGGRPFPSWLLVLDGVGVCHILSVFEYTYIDTAITPELGYNQLIRQIDRMIRVMLRRTSSSHCPCVQKLLCPKNQRPLSDLLSLKKSLPVLGRVVWSGVHPDRCITIK